MTILGIGQRPINAFSSPDDIASLVAWWDADEEVYNDAGSTLASVSDLVYQWNDLKNSSNLIQATSTNRPVLETRSSKRVIRFDGADNFMTAADNANLDLGNVFSIFVVLTVNATFSDFVFCSKGTDAYLMKSAGSGKLQLQKQGTGVIRDSGTNLSASTFYKYTIRRDGSNRTIRKDGADDSGAVDNNFTTTDTSTDLNVGRNSGGSEFLDGEIRALLLFNAYISDADCANLESYYA